MSNLVNKNSLASMEYLFRITVFVTKVILKFGFWDTINELLFSTVRNFIPIYCYFTVSGTL